MLGALASRPKKIGFHLPSWNSRFVSLSKVVSAYLQGQSDEMKRRDFFNAHKAEPWTEETSEALDAKALVDRREPYGPEIPAQAGLLTCGVDVQQDRLELEVVAHGANDETWGVEYRVLPGDTSLPGVWHDLAKYINGSWTHASGAEMKLGACFVDSGYRSKEVYNFTFNRFNRHVIATKGYSVPGKALITGPKKHRIGNRKIHLISIGTDTAKDTLFDHLAVEKPGHGFCHFSMQYNEKYFEQFTTERRYTKFVKGHAVHEWRKTNNNARNEAIDLRVLNIAAKVYLNRNIEKPVDDLNNTVQSADTGANRSKLERLKSRSSGTFAKNALS